MGCSRRPELSAGVFRSGIRVVASVSRRRLDCTVANFEDKSRFRVSVDSETPSQCLPASDRPNERTNDRPNELSLFLETINF